MEEIQSANQSAPETPIETTTAPEAPVTTQEAPQEPQGIKVKYNKEERVISHDEAPTYIQKGLNYDKLQERATQFENHSKYLERIAKLEGFDDLNAYMQAIEQAEEDRRIREEADRLGVDEDVVRRFNSVIDPLKQQVEGLTAQQQEYENLKNQLEIQKQLVDLRQKYPDFDQYGERVVEIVEKKGYALEDAYILASHEDKVARLRKETEAETIRNLQQNSESSPGPLGQGDVSHETGFGALPKEQQRRMIEEVKRGERRSF